MSEIIPPSQSIGKPIPTAEKFLSKWREANFGSQRSGLYDDEWLQFAEAYAVHYSNYLFHAHSKVMGQQDDLLRRAAELLRNSQHFYTTIHGVEWQEKRKQWLKDAGMEK